MTQRIKSERSIFAAIAPGKSHRSPFERRITASAPCIKRCPKQRPRGHTRTEVRSYEDMGIWRRILFTLQHHREGLLIDPKINAYSQDDSPRPLETLKALLAQVDSKQTASRRQPFVHLGNKFLPQPCRLAPKAANTPTVTGTHRMQPRLRNREMCHA